MTYQNEGNGLFAALPTEICHFVLGYMDKESRDAFARCSRHCYSIAFPARFIGIKLSEVNHRYWLKVFTRGWLAPLARWVHTVVLDIADLKYLTILPSKLTVFPNLRGLNFHIHAPKPFEGNVFTVLFRFLCTLPFYNNITYLSINWYAYQVVFDTDIIFIGQGFGAAQQEQERKKEEKMRKQYDEDIQMFPEVEEMLGPHLSKVQVIEKTLNGEIYFPKKLQTLELGMGSQTPYYLIPMLNCSNITTLVFDFFPSELRDSKALSSVLQFPMVKTMVFSHVGFYADTKIINNHFPNVEFMSVTKYCTLSWTEFIKAFPKVKIFNLPWHKMRWRYVEVGYLERAIKKLLKPVHLPLYPTISFSGNYEADGGMKYIHLTCKLSLNASGGHEINWEGDTGYKLEDMKLADFQEEILRDPRSGRDLDGYDRDWDRDDSSGEEMDAGSDHSEYVDTGSDEYEFSDGEEEEESYGGDSEYWEGGDDEVEDMSDEDSEVDLEENGAV
ncbi:hypothetical protein TWF679_000146 [Orbilia oligospora]|uniref:F-box domain-containing protein n=1 Tax=Orbilia oligospora TaxID=2813651 RepID=A0A8H8VN71_ORBOL|nr:hypothetical protein TWF679_000146 [Orbilia oligospora]